MKIAQVVKTRGSCVIYQVGAVLVQGRQIIATGYNGTPRGVLNCNEGGCARCAKKKSGILQSGEQKGNCICVHAEINAILQCAYYGMSTKDATMYTTTSPCMLCAKEMINAGIRRVYFEIEDTGETKSLILLRKYLDEVKQIK